MTATAKLFWNGRSQAVRLPKEFRMPGKEVRIRRQGAAVVLEPIADGWEWLDDVVGKAEDFFPDGRNQPEMPPPRPGLDDLFC